MISFFTSIYAGVAVFAIIGYMAIEYEVPVNCVINSGALYYCDNHSSIRTYVYGA